MTEEFYHANLFGEVVDVDLQAADEGEKLPLDKKGMEFNIFALTDALGARDRKRAWILYQEALAAGVAAEEIFWKVAWQIKSLLIAKNTESAAETDMKTFPYMKAKGNLKHWQEGELEKLSEEIVLGYHRARRGIGEIETLIEKIILKL